MRNVLAIALMLSLCLIGLAFNADTFAQTPGPTLSPPSARPARTVQLPPLAEGAIGGWCVQNQGEDLFIHSQYSPRGPRIRIWRASNGWLQFETQRGSATLWSSGNFEAEPMDYSEGKIRCPSAALQQGKHAFGSWQFDVAPTEVRIDHSRNPHTIVLEVRSARVRLEGLPGGPRLVEPTTALTP